MNLFANCFPKGNTKTFPFGKCKPCNIIGFLALVRNVWYNHSYKRDRQKSSINKFCAMLCGSLYSKVSVTQLIINFNPFSLTSTKQKGELCVLLKRPFFNAAKRAWQKAYGVEKHDYNQHLDNLRCSPQPLLLLPRV